MTLRELQPLIINWAAEKDLLKPENASKQRLKLIEEVGEIASAILRNNVEGIKDGIGDVYVVLVILSAQVGQPLDMENYKDEFYSNLTIDEILSAIIYYEVNVNFDIIYKLCDKLNVNFEDCANLAWNEIKNRTGKTVGGTFIKN